MKTILPLLLLLMVASCARRPPAFAPVEPARPAPTGAAARPTPVAQPPAPAQIAPAPTPAPVPAAAATNTALVRVPAVPAPTPTNAAAQTPVDVSAPARVSVPPPEPTVGAGEIDFRNMPLEQVLGIYAELVNKTLLRPAALPAQQITLTTQTPLTRSEAIQALKAVLALNGITVVDFGDKFVKVMAEPQAGTSGAAIDTRDAAQLPEFGSYVTHIVQLKYLKPSEAMPSLMPFARIPSAILPIETSQILVLRDYTENVKRMLEMIERIDVSVPAVFISEVIPIKYAKASEIADALNSLGGGGSTTPIGGGTRTGARPGAVGGGAARGMGTPGAYGQQGSTYGTRGAMGGLGGMGGVGGVGGAGAGAGSITDRIQRIIQRASTSGDLQILGQTKMIADERSNSLLIFATREDMEMIKTIVSKLDVVLSQVIIDSIIMDVSLSQDKALGFSAVQTTKSFDERNPDGSIKSGGAGGMNASKFFDFSGSSSSGTNVFNELLGTGLRYFAKVDQNYLLQVQAAVSDGRVDVIQKPRILTSHATPGSIFVGSTVPYVTSTYYGGGYGGPSSSYQQLSVGIGLTVTPYINPDGLVVMQIDETIDELAGSTDIVGVGAVPNTTHRSLSAEIAVRDGDSIILGGFIRNANTKTKSGVPILMNIPLLGSLFSSRSSSKDRKELLVLMRPTVLKTPDIAALTSMQEKSRMPGVANAEAEAMAEQQQEMEKLQKKLRSHPNPVGPERKDIYGNPQPSQY